MIAFRNFSDTGALIKAMSLRTPSQTQKKGCALFMRTLLSKLQTELLNPLFGRTAPKHQAQSEGVVM